MPKVREKGSASVAYRVNAETFERFKDRQPKHIRLTYIYETLFDVIMNDEEFQDAIAEATGTYIVPASAKFVYLSISTVDAAKRLQINRALWKLLKSKVSKYRRPKDIGINGVVTVAVGLVADGEFDLPLD